MEKLVVGCVQVRMRLPQTLDELAENLERFMRTAEAKRVRLIVFPQLAGLMAAAPLTKGARTGLLKTADLARRSNVSFWTRTRARMAGGVAGMLKADFGKALEQSLMQHPDDLWQAYAQVFGGLAQRHTVTVVAGTTYLVDPDDGAVRHLSLVFGPDGEHLGQQAAVTLAANEVGFVAPGTRWQVIPTPAGRLGILIGNDMLYPEAGRLLAYAGAEILVGLGTANSPKQYQRQRHGLLARVEENQLYGVMSFTVGYNPFTPGEEAPYVGRSLLAAPIAMTPRYNGILVEMGVDSTEGLLTAEWDFPALRRLWQEDEAPLRATMPIRETGRFLAAIYSRGLTIDEATRIGEVTSGPLALAEPTTPAPATAALEQAPDAATEAMVEEERVLTPPTPTSTADDGAALAADEMSATGFDMSAAALEDGDATSEDDLPLSPPSTPRRWPWSRSTD